MAKLHIIGVGGTGHKMINAAIHLAACGAFKGNLGKHTINEIRVLTIDADDSNGNLTQTKTTLSAYRNYFTALSGASDLGLVPIEPISGDANKLNIALFKQDKKSVSAAFNVPQYADSDDDAFIRFLYTDDEINADFEQGFYGHTSIGTLIVKDILKTNDVWQTELGQINQNDFVFAVGSIFGGTGASAIPVLLDELHAKQKETGFSLAALVLNPYFKTAGEIREEGALHPDARNFNIKAKASLYYYFTQSLYQKTNALYIIGEPESNYSIERASRGAANQRNKASAVELFAASALIDFVRESDDRKDNGIITAQRAVKDNTFLYTWDMLKNSLPHLPANIQTAIKTAVFYNKVLYSELAHGNEVSEWRKYYDSDLAAKKDDNQNLIYENIHKYLDLLVRWFHDIHKQNKNEINQNTDALMWDADARVKLFNANYEKLFNDSSVPDKAIENFENLIYRDTKSKKSGEIYSLLAAKKPTGDRKDFAALFTALYALMREEKKGFLGFSAKPPEPETFDMIPYLSRENNATFSISAAPDKLWTKSQPMLLAGIADGLPSVISESFTKNDISIPSPWSIFIMNELTLTEPKFAAINKAAFKEWCGVIALLVARKICLYEKQGLKVETLNLGGGDGDFLRVVNDTLKPESFVFDNPNWIKCYRLSLEVEYPEGTKDVTIAFLANNMLVCPAYSLDTVTKGKLNRIAPTIIDENGGFLSPDNYFKDQSRTLNKDAKYALKLFLLELKAILTRSAAVNKKNVIAKLQNLTDKYLAEISSVTPNPNLAIPPEKKAAVQSVADLFEELVITPSKTNIERPFLMDGANIPSALIGTSVCGISSSSAEAAHHLITENILFNQITAATIGEYKNTVKDGVRLIYADELLLDSMVMIIKDGTQVFHALPNNSSLSNYEIVWPISDALLDLYPAEKLNSMLSIKEDGEKAVVSLKIKLGSVGAHTVSKEYRVKPLSEMTEGDKQLNGMCWLMEKNSIPFWSIYPYAKINDSNGKNVWQRYNCFCVEPNYRGIPVLDIKPVFKGGGAYLAGERKLSTLQTVQREYYYRRYITLPSAFKVSEKTDSVPIPRGVAFLAEPKTVNAGAVRWNVGIDFGTTSTTAFYTTSGDSTPRFIQLMNEYEWKEGNSEPKKFEYNNDLVTLCDSGDSSADIYFIDKQSFKQNGFATALEIMDSSSALVDATIFSDKRIFWHNYENFKVINTQEGRKERLLTNIKWESNKSNSAKYLNQLLTQIVYHAAEKGVRNISFFFSYPTAFGPGAKDDFSSKVNGIIKLLAEESGVALTFSEKHNLVTESIAAAYYFNHKKPRNTVFFCVDIGGGSTDASIWVKTKHIFQTSIHFASRDMFIRAMSRLVHIPSVLKAVTTEDRTDGIYTMLSEERDGIKMTGDRFKFLIETVLFEYNTPLVNRLQDMEGQDQQAYKIFKYCVLIAYSGLIYYLANILASLFTTKDEKRRIDNDISEVILGLSGKGSKLTDWIKSYCDIIYHEAGNLIKEKTLLDIDINPDFSPETAKTETAIGMICNLDGDGKPRNQADTTDPDVFMGSDITVVKKSEKRELRSGDFADVYNDPFFSAPKELKIELDKDMGELDSFIAFFNRITAKTGNEMQPIDSDSLNEKMKKNLWNKTKQEAENSLSEGRFEPPFIIMLKVFLEEYTEEFLWKKID